MRTLPERPTRNNGAPHSITITRTRFGGIPWKTDDARSDNTGDTMKTMSQYPRRRLFGVRPLVRSAFAASLLAGLTAASTAPRPAALSPRGTSGGTCQLDYQRADNMWAPFGVPKGSLGTESIGLTSGQKKIFLTDWKYEKMRNDGYRYYGSHLRIATNRSAQAMTITIRGWEINGMGGVTLRTYPITLAPYASRQFQHDLVDLLCQ